MRTFRRVVATAVAALAAGACQLIAGIDDRADLRAPVDALAPNADAESAAAAADSAPPYVCGARWPAPPELEDPEGDTGRIFDVVNWASLSLAADAGFPEAGGDAGKGYGYGWDLDCVTTCDGPESCFVHKGQTQPPRHCDQANGRDNETQELNSELRALEPALAGFFDIGSSILGGKASLLIEITGYNGGRNDKHVLLSVLAASGLITPDGGFPDDAGHPSFTPEESWYIDPRSVMDASTTINTPLYSDINAYVNEGVVVASIARISLAFGYATGARAIFSFSDTTISGKLVKRGAGYAIEDGHIGGRITTRDLLTALASFSDPFDPARHVCGDDATYANAKVVICGGADLSRDPVLGVSGRPCEALSAGIGFTAVPTFKGPLGSVDAGAPFCVLVDGGPWTDDCDPDWPLADAADAAARDAAK